MCPVWAFKLLKKSSSTLSRPASIIFSNWKKTNALAHWLLTCPSGVGEVHLSDKPVPPWAWIPEVCGLRVDDLSLAIWIQDLWGDRNEKQRHRALKCSDGLTVMMSLVGLVVKPESFYSDIIFCMMDFTVSTMWECLLQRFPKPD